MNIRSRGLAQLAAGAAPLALIAWLAPAEWVRQVLDALGKLAIFALAMPAVVALAGLVELVSGVPFWRIAERWDALRGWQRGVLGLAIVAAFTACWFAGVVLFA